MVDSGPILNGVLLSMGLIDEIRLLVSPVLVGSKSDKLLNQLAPPNQDVSLKLLSCEELGEGFVWLKYGVLK